MSNQVEQFNQNIVFCMKVQGWKGRIDEETQQQLLEWKFMALFIYNQWNGIILNFPKVYKHFDLEDYVKHFMQVLPLIEYHKKSMKEAKSLTEKVEMDPIACFNIDGERICVLKRSIAEVFPGSQLAIRFSGRWREQSNDLDEEGNMNLEVSKYAFKRIVSSIRASKVKDRGNRNKESPVGSSTFEVKRLQSIIELPILFEREKEVNALLDYFAIENATLILQSF